jgi:hypothetical protein
MYNLYDFRKVWCWDELEAFLGYDCAVLGEEDKGIEFNESMS